MSCIFQIPELLFSSRIRFQVLKISSKYMYDRMDGWTDGGQIHIVREPHNDDSHQ